MLSHTHAHERELFPDRPERVCVCLCARLAASLLGQNRQIPGGFRSCFSLNI